MRRSRGYPDCQYMCKGWQTTLSSECNTNCSQLLSRNDKKKNCTRDAFFFCRVAILDTEASIGPSYPPKKSTFKIHFLLGMTRDLLGMTSCQQSIH